MNRRVSNNFIKSVQRMVDDCSSTVQLRGCFNRYKTYFFVEEIRAYFFDKLGFFSDMHEYKFDSVLRNQFEALKEDFELEDMIASAYNGGALLQPGKNSKKLVRAYQNDVNLEYLNRNDFLNNSTNEEQLLCTVFKINNGNKLQIRWMLDIDNETLNKKVNQYKLKGYLNEIRRDFRANLKDSFKDTSYGED